ncbi:DUF6343 family protein [Streptomyces sp. NPDC020983]|uniref:DUF6343 family protein n=1 Tax=Streptomyces sp. NPDC020983 TaxID=3365106 RepID=UPI0037B39E24
MRRTGYEPTQARSPLRLRFGLALCGLLWGAAAAVVFAVYGHPGWAAFCAAVAAVAAADCVLVVRRIRQGAHFQPGRDVPPYEPVRERDRADHGQRRGP